MVSQKKTVKNKNREKEEIKEKKAEMKGKEKISEKDSEGILREPAVLKGQPCPYCHTNNLTLREEDMDMPFFGLVSIFSMDCSNCDFKNSDVECIEKHPPSRYTLEVSSDEDMKIRIVKSSTATVKIPYIGNMEPGPSAEGFITNVEGLLMRFKEILQAIRENEEEDEESREKAKNMMKKIDRAIWGREKIRIIIEDPEGNSGIVSEKAVVEKLPEGKK